MQIKSHLDHTNINVLDIEKSIKFYEENLNMKVTKRKDNDKFTILFLSDSTDSKHRIELTHLKDRTKPYDLSDSEVHISVRVEDYQKVKEFHRANGVIVYENKAMDLYFIADPDGYWIEILDINRP